MNTRLVIALSAVALTAVAGTPEARACSITWSTTNGANAINTTRTQTPELGNQTTGKVLVSASAGLGLRQDFQGGSVFAWESSNGCLEGAFDVKGLILNLYNSLNAENGFLGWPLTNEFEADGSINTGRVSRFEGGDIYCEWQSPSFCSAFEVNGWILAMYNVLGAQRSPLGYPIANETSYSAAHIASGRISKFENGEIIYGGGGTGFAVDTWPVLFDVVSPTIGPQLTATQPINNGDMTNTYSAVSGCGYTPGDMIAVSFTSPSVNKGIDAGETIVDGSGCFVLNNVLVPQFDQVNGVTTFLVSDEHNHWQVLGAPYAF